MIKSIRSLHSFLHLTPVEVNAILKSIDACYIRSTIAKKKYGEVQRDKQGNIKYRTLLIPVRPLKMAQQRINKLLQKINLPHYMYGSIPKRNHIMNAQQHLNQRYFITIDLKNFFSNITHYQVHEMFLNHGFSYSTSHILTKLTTYQGSLPQGAPSSPVIANLVFLNTSDKLFKLAKKYNITYTNYLDDQSFSSKKPFKEFTPRLLDIIKQDNFFPSHNKIHHRSYRCEITGLIVCGNILRVIPEMRKKSRANINLKAYVKSIDKCNCRLQSKL